MPQTRQWTISSFWRKSSNKAVKQKTLHCYHYAVLALVFLTPLFSLADDDLQDNTSQFPPHETPAKFVSLALTKPLALDEAIDLALQRNPDLHIANERIASAEAQFGETLAAFYPQIKARLAYQYSDNPSHAFGMIVSQRRFDFASQDINRPGGTTDFRPEVIGTISLFRGGQDYHRSKTAELGIEISSLQRSTIRNNLVQAVTDSFYALLVAQENKTIALRSIDAISRELEHTRIRFEGGTVLKSDVLSLKVQLASAQEAEIRAQNAIEMSRMVMRTLLDLTPTSPVETVRSKNIELPTLDRAFSEMLAQAKTERPEIQTTLRQTQTRRQQLDIARGEHLPRVDAFINYGLNREKVGFSSEQDNLTAGVAMEMDLFSGFGTQQRIHKAERDLSEAQETERKVRLQITQEVKNAYLALKEALQRLKVTETSVAASEEALRLVTEQHQAGTITVTRFIEAQAARDQANARTVAARYDTFRADAALNRAMGAWK
ncbi:MAG: TolC family protein [Methylococcales bacterium]